MSWKAFLREIPYRASKTPRHLSPCSSPLGREMPTLPMLADGDPEATMIEQVIPIGED